MAAPISRRYEPATTLLGEQEPVNLDFLPLSETFVGVFVESGNATYGVEITLDDVNDHSITPRWFELKGFGIANRDSAYVSFSHPVRFARLNIASFTGPIELKIAQAVDGLV